MAYSSHFRFHVRVQPIFFVTGTDTGVGKTVLTALLASFLRQRGIKVAALKPICSGGRADAIALHKAQAGTLTLDEINPWHFRAPIAPLLAARREKKPVRLRPVVAHIQSIHEKSDITIVEGAGGLLSPLGEDFGSLDLIIALRANPLIVAPNRLGVLNHLLLTLKALPKPIRTRASIVLMSPAKPDAATTSNTSLLAKFFSPNDIFMIPWLGRRFSTTNVLAKRPIQLTLKSLVPIYG
jgi:dethiobiotin synthetase